MADSAMVDVFSPLGQAFDGHRTLTKALHTDGVRPATAGAIGAFVAQMHLSSAEVESAATTRGVRAEEEGFVALHAAMAGSSLYQTDVPLHDALESLQSELSESLACRCHGHLVAEGMRVSEESWIPVDGSAAGWRWRAVGSAAADVGSFLASIFIVGIARAYSAGALPAPAPTWPPAPPSERSTIHRTAHAFWTAYLKERCAAYEGELDEVVLLQLCAGYAGCQLLLYTLDESSMGSALDLLPGSDRTSAIKCAAAVGRELILHSRDKLTSFDGVLTLFDSNTLDSKHKVQAFCVFEDS